MDRTLPLTVGITAVQAAVRLHLYLGFLKRVINLYKLMTSPLNSFLLGINPLHLDKLE
jgi:hypothetical protein